MPYSIFRRRHALIVLLLLVLSGAAFPAAARSVTTTAALLANPTTLSANIPLGQRLNRTITLNNNASSSVTPAIYKALPAAVSTTFADASNPSGPGRVPLPQQAQRLDAGLRDELARSPDGRGDFLVYLRDQADLSAAYALGDWSARGGYVYQTLTDWAASSQQNLRQQLTARGLAYRPLWIVNAVLVHGALADAYALAGRGDVALVRANRMTALPPEESVPTADLDQCSPDQPGNSLCWNIRKIGVDRVWRDFGVTGQGIVVASIDTGVSFTHPALTTSYRGYLGPGRYTHDYNWFDPQGTQTLPTDLNGHGTHTMGTMVAAGDGSPTHPSVGIAPGARWIAAQGCEVYLCSESDLIESAQWVLAPTTIAGTQPRPDLRPMIVNNSWAGTGGDRWYAGYTAAWRAAGIFPIFAAGNAGGSAVQTCGSVDSPADYPDVVGVGATDATDTLAYFSLLGPSSDGRIKPDVVAPGTYLSGQGVLSTAINAEGYQALQGTSMAAPHVAGLVALLWSANPALIGDYNTTYAILRDSARHLSDTRCGDPPGAPNNVYGQGRIDAYAAVARTRVDLPWLTAPATLRPIAAGGSASFDIALDASRVPGPGVYRARLQIFNGDLGQAPTTITIMLNVTPAAQQATITGHVVSADTGAPVQATIGVYAGLGVPTDVTGAFTLTLALGSYELVVSAPAFLPAQRLIALAGDMQLADFVLHPDQPHIVVSSPPDSINLAIAQHPTPMIALKNSGLRVLNYTAQVAPDYYGVWRSDEPGGPTYQWVDLPASAPVMHLGNNNYRDNVPLGISFPFFNYTYTQTLVTANGTLTFGDPLRYGGPLTRCLPDDELFFYLIAPFRADMDSARGGDVRYGTLPGGKTFVLSYEDVPLHDGPLDATYTFQLLLHDDGRIGFQYKTLAPLPDTLSVGVQRTPLELQQIGCGAATPIANGTAIELRPQDPATYWMSSSIQSGTLSPGEQRALGVRLTWVRPNAPWPYRARIEIVSSDPIRSHITVPFEVRMLPAPAELTFPLMPNRS
jgi:subtilisin family serine protease